jgi:hypothetical protein
MTGRVSAWAVANEPAVKAKFGNNAFTKGELEREFGDVDIGGGVKLREALKGVDAATNFADVGAVVGTVASTQAKAIVDAGAATVAGLGSVGINVGAEGPNSATVELFSAATPAEKAALAAAGIRTVGQLAEANPARVAEALTATAGSADAGRLAAGRLRGIALTVGKLGR